MENSLALPESMNVDLYAADESITGKLPRLPENLGYALKLAGKSDFLKNTLNEQILENYIRLKTIELQAFGRTTDKRTYFLENYFKMI